MAAVLLLILSFAPSLAAATPAFAQAGGQARVVDGDTLELDGNLVHLHGIDAPELAQNCARRGTLWRCGEAAVQTLQRLTAGRTVRCRSLYRRDDGQRTGRCRAGWLDLAAEMVSRGLAIADLAVSRDYLRNHREARAVGSGMFGGTFVNPGEWRNGKRLDIEPPR